AGVAVAPPADVGGGGRRLPRCAAERKVLLVGDHAAGLVELGRRRAEVVGELVALARGRREAGDAGVEGLALDERGDPRCVIDVEGRALERERAGGAVAAAVDLIAVEVDAIFDETTVLVRLADALTAGVVREVDLATAAAIGEHEPVAVV